MGQEIALPDWAKNKPAAAFAALNPADDNLSDGIGQSYPVLSYKGKQWAMRFRGEKKNFIQADGFPAPYIDVIILGQAKQKSKSFYKKFDPNQDGERPICSSIDGIVPDPDVIQKQCDTCVLCPKNVYKADPQTGRKGRECTDYKRIAVLVLPTQTKPLFGAPVLEPAFLRIPPASLNPLAIMGDTMSGQGYHYSSYITRISFDPNEAHPKMVFIPQQGLTDQEAPVVLQMRQDANVERIISGGYTEGMRVVPPQEGTTLIPPPQQTGLTLENPPQQPQQQAVQQAAPNAAPPPNGVQTTGLVTLTNGNGLVNGNGLGVGTQQAPPPQPAAAGQLIAGDTGAPEAADQDLDAKIASMLGSKK